MSSVLLALIGTTFTFLTTALGAAVVFLFKNRIGARVQRVCLGFAAGVMAAATAFSLLVPASGMMGEGTAWMILPQAFLLGAGAVMAWLSLRDRDKLLDWGMND